MQGHRRRRVTRKRVPRDRPQPPSARRVAAGRHRFLLRLLFCGFNIEQKGGFSWESNDPL